MKTNCYDVNSITSVNRNIVLAAYHNGSKTALYKTGTKTDSEGYLYVQIDDDAVEIITETCVCAMIIGFDFYNWDVYDAELAEMVERKG